MNDQIGPKDYLDFVATLFNQTGDLSKDFAHAVLGLTTELEEWGNAEDPVNSLEELGDLLFFNTALAQTLHRYALNLDREVELIDVVQDTPEEICAAYMLSDKAEQIKKDLLRGPLYERLWSSLQHLQDAAKRWIGYGKAPDAEQVPDLLLFANTVVYAVMSAESIDSEDEFQEVIRVAAKANIAKLEHRYPGGKFDADHAVNRDLKGERDALVSAQSE